MKNLLNKKRIFSVLSVVLLIAAILVSRNVLRRLFLNKTDALKTVNAFYAQDDNSVDIAFVGSSRIFCDINPAILWDERGITAFDLATGAQPIEETVLMVKELFKTQHPQVVVVEVSQINVENNYDAMQIEPLTQDLKPSVDRYKMIFEKSAKDALADNVFAFSLIHDRYEDIAKDDQSFWNYYEYKDSKEKGHKGFVDYWHNVYFENFGEPSIDSEEVPGYVIDSLSDIKKICDENNSELMLIYSPDINLHDYSAFYDFSARNGVKYINANTVYDQIGLDTKQDFIDEGHLNTYGANKWTRYIGDVICQDHIFESKKGDAKYKSWDDNLAYILDAEKAYKMPLTTELLDYFSYFPNPDYVMIVSLVGDYKSIFAGQQDLLQRHCGITADEYERGGTWVFYNFECLYNSQDNELLNWSYDINDKVIEIKGTKNAPEIYVDGEDEGVIVDGKHLENGIQIITFDTLKNRVIDAIDFNVDKGFAWERSDS